MLTKRIPGDFIRLGLKEVGGRGKEAHSIRSNHNRSRTVVTRRQLVFSAGVSSPPPLPSSSLLLSDPFPTPLVSPPPRRFRSAKSPPSASSWSASPSSSAHPTASAPDTDSPSTSSSPSSSTPSPPSPSPGPSHSFRSNLHASSSPSHQSQPRSSAGQRAHPPSPRTFSSVTRISSEGPTSLQGMPPELPTVSVVIPVFNEVHNIPILIERVGEALSKAGWPHEIVIVDDGSTDGSTAVLRCVAAEKPEVRILILNRNFGQSAAMMAGFDFAAGEVIVTLDGDLQNDAADIPHLLDCLVFGESSSNGAAFASDQQGVPASEGALVRRSGAGYDLVCGWRRDRKDDFISRNLPSAVANFLIGRLTGVKLHDYGCCLKAYRGELARSFRLYGELHRFLPALAAMEGASVHELPVQHHPRRTGKSKYGIFRTPRVLLDLALILFMKSFRDRPMQFFGFLAIFPLAVSCIFFSLFCSAAIKTGTAYGWGMALSVCLPHLVATLEFLMGGVLLICLGLVADMCMRTYYESQDRAVYRVREVALSEG